ncbi:MAG: diguanylate cyclase [Myxococcales bacterium]|nr:diguanylate cyclase [Myxococcales bacterium]
MPSSEPALSAVVLDPQPGQARRLEDSVRAAGFLARPALSLDDFCSALGGGGSRVGVLAFETLWPQPQEKLKAVRAAARRARLVVAHADDSGRLRLGKRLWSSGAIDFFVPRSMPSAEFAEVMRQADADALLAAESPSGAARDPAGLLKLLRGLSASFANQRTVAGLLRELHVRLTSLVDYSLLQVFVPSGNDFTLFVFQTRPLAHELVWRLVEQTCEVLSHHAGRPVKPEELQIDDSTPVSGIAPEGDQANALEWRPVVFPMLAPNGLVGCMSLLVPSSQAEASRPDDALEFVSYQLATALGRVQLLETAARASLVDSLTGCHNRRYFEQVLSSEWKRSTRYALYLSVAVVDIDAFTQFNAIYGHQLGDEILRQLAGFLASQLRETDHLARLEGAQLAVLLPETGAPEASAVLERLRILVGSKALLVNEQHGPLQISVSAGVASYPACAVDSAEGLLERARTALRTAKAAGRDRVCIAALPGSEAVQAELVGHSETAEMRNFPRIPTRMNVRYLEVPDFEQGIARVMTADISAGGVALMGGSGQFKKNAFGLVFIENAQKAMLTRVVWTADGADGSRRAGLRFVSVSELDQMADVPRDRTGGRRALVVLPNDEIRLMVARVLRAAQVQATILEEGEEWPADLMLDQLALVVATQGGLRGPLASKLQGMSEHAGTRVVLINESGDRRQAVTSILSHRLRHLVAADEAFDEALFATLNKLLLGEYFGIRKYLLWGSRSQSWTVSYGEDRSAVLEGVRQLASEVRCHPRVTDLLVTAVDEMIINALYRAPPESGAQGKPVAVECGSDGRLLVVSVLDEHGRFKPSHLYAGLGRALENERNTIPDDSDSASLGFRIMLEALSQLAINVEPGRATEIIGIVDLRKSLREYRSSSPSVNLFTRE